MQIKYFYTNQSSKIRVRPSTQNSYFRCDISH